MMLQMDDRMVLFDGSKIINNPDKRTIIEKAKKLLIDGSHEFYIINFNHDGWII